MNSRLSLTFLNNSNNATIPNANAGILNAPQNPGLNNFSQSTISWTADNTSLGLASRAYLTQWVIEILAAWMKSVGDISIELPQVARVLRGSRSLSYSVGKPGAALATRAESLEIRSRRTQCRNARSGQHRCSGLRGQGCGVM